MSNSVFRFATVSGQSIHWLLKRNCSITPRQLLWFYLSLCVVSFGIAAMFWVQGVRLVMPFAWLELLALGAALLLYARHATDSETIALPATCSPSSWPAAAAASGSRSSRTGCGSSRGTATAR